MKWIEFSQLKPLPNIACRSFTRKGGVSHPPFDSLNLGHGVGDEEELVAENIERVKEEMGIDNLVWTNQIHGKKVVALKAPPEGVLECDGLATNTPGLALMIRHADCQAAIFYDPRQRAVAAVHAGWRGSVANIYAETVEVMRQEFGSDPSDLLVSISPSIGPTAAEFLNYQEELPRSFWDFQEEPGYFNFWKISRHQLAQAGVPPEQIEVAERCTYCEPEEFFSYRRDRTTGRQGTIVVLTP